MVAGSNGCSLTWYALANLAGIPNANMIRDIESGRDAQISTVQLVPRRWGCGWIWANIQICVETFFNRFVRHSLFLIALQPLTEKWNVHRVRKSLQI